MVDDETPEQKDARQRIHEAIDRELAEWNWDDDDVLVEWVVVVATSSPVTGRVDVGGIASEGLPWYRTVGLLHASLDRGWVAPDDDE
jgi:hypothetical protein